MKNIDRKKSLYADLSLFIVAIIWGGGFIAVKNSIDDVSPFYLLTLRFGISSIIMAIILHKRIKNITKKDIKAGVIVGIFLFLGFVAQTYGIKYTTAGKNAFLTGVNVIIVPFLYWMVSKKKPDIYAFVSAFISFIGMAMLTLNGGLYIGIGDGLTILCAFFFAGHIVAVGYYTDTTDPIILSIVQMAAVTIFSLICAFVFETPPTTINKSLIIGVGYISIFSTMLAFIIQNVAQKYTYPTHAAIILCLESVFGSIFSVIFLKEIFTIKMIAGCVLIFIAIITSETKWNFLTYLAEVSHLL
ncbi:putative DMT superfamily transporter inner membrane protein [Clostridium tepidiprofundi DSM 19306]|uniref:Putative DMT superfamily transporter inner membrane protein n=1 Tax=Clostridium tepidiprofundi DSM 19306 TaxID=1121338 RepID=A0A151AWC3_9CLOT|nr:DMT family transporter [Clostridium tepidiprofundi]KYH31911.1 putative DMT superfamily transporter inner membrane protein [Clostridium tepidiprofundi DSM 19306]